MKINNLKITNSIVEEQTDTDSLNDFMEELGIEMSSKNDEDYKLILWNDEVNGMDFVMSCLINICNLNETESFFIMLEAHTKGKAVAKRGSYGEMVSMKNSLNSMNIEATVEK